MHILEEEWESEDGADNLHLDVTWHGQLIDSFRDIYVDSEKNRYDEGSRWPLWILWTDEDGTPLHVATCVRQALQQRFGDRVISRNFAVLLPPLCPDLTSVDFWFWVI
ncbi:hypothetical protein AVEN_84597-1 [Araneus ventricosus]|uniref:Uncharacterized protein n=1 Tax=Araneus ventricosus TaxID=182803 RepID=A0A4Y2C180_ARAVE|nr:hypothetical protein AVEN_84597-1 [Araneus ventricosus]